MAVEIFPLLWCSAELRLPVHLGSCLQLIFTRALSHYFCCCDCSHLTTSVQRVQCSILSNPPIHPSAQFRPYTASVSKDKVTIIIATITPTAMSPHVNCLIKIDCISKVPPTPVQQNVLHRLQSVSNVFPLGQSLKHKPSFCENYNLCKAVYLVGEL